ncbi:mediator of RNA polymerase II transcription subunit 29-like [Lineus longissimus]|uniref:mediator of RNA polymerase II transcription subunit 29-like n=1 Tax=Lineus longissimus TaxID=88925 RepID=UPI002B4D01E0
MAAAPQSGQLQQQPQQNQAPGPSQLQQQQQAQLQQQQQDVDPVAKLKVLTPHLKESLTMIMKIAAQNFHQNAQIDNCSKSSEATVQRFDKSLEEFFAICDQIEMNIKLALECNNVNADSTKNTPVLVHTSKSDPQQGEAQSYTQYVSTVKTQVTHAKELRDMLLDCARKISERPGAGVH